MTRTARGCAIALALLTATTPALAAGCAQPKDQEALEAAGMQQRLMVAALTCNDVPLYNRFVLTYRTELQTSDAQLMSFFRRTSGGEAQYHAYKTHLANGSELDRLHNASFCADADASFRSALMGARVSLDDVLASEPEMNTGYETCFSREARADTTREDRRAAAVPASAAVRW